MLLQRPAHPRPPPQETGPPRLYPGQSLDPHKHLFDLGVLAPPLGHLSHSINPGFTGARAHAPNPLLGLQAGCATRASPGALPPRPSPHLTRSSFPATRDGARREPGVTRVGPRARRARLTKSGAAPCVRATGPGGRGGQRPRPGAGKRPSLPGPARSRRSLSRPERARCPIFPENTPLFGPSWAPRRDTPARRARRYPARATGAAGARRHGCDARACQPAFPRLPATRARARPPRASSTRPAATAHPVPSGRSLPPARAPLLTLGAQGGKTGWRQQQGGGGGGGGARPGL